MTPEQQRQMESDFRDFRAQFIHELARELADCVPPESIFNSQQYVLANKFEQILSNRLPGAQEVRYIPRAEM